MKNFFVSLAFLLLEVGIGVLVRNFYGKVGKNVVEDIVTGVDEMTSEGKTLTSKQKFNEAKKKLKSIRGDLPEFLTNLVIEGVVANKNKDRIKDQIKKDKEKSKKKKKSK